ncbi:MULTISPECIES: DUF4245 domain-containing protein [Streptomyces]|uniref:DUF4245 domain-containing protein n=1 Tax=Streptomyces TaxID=1883 RepID=UPI00226DCA90|nr:MULTISPECIES: DUF4245 domain-containing protein [unclassified Streptomyces]MCY0940651.1 DUF4245 domain-containing protein [Streptomyces sp. H34-AA3]MCY0948531.1 DUF4245 domain-containing protein [Streptomyces sp. H27-S2]MCZ4082081.1 DUF4245 domain-containing protein [Streptomyces sp. H34-S5]
MKGKQTIWDMVRSLGVIGLVVAGIYLFIPHDEKADPTRTVDYRVETITARRAAPYPLAVPVGLPAEWRATSVTYERKNASAWHLGFLDPKQEYVALEQSTDVSGKYLGRVTQQAKATGQTQQVGDAAWERWEGEKYDALVKQDQGYVTVVTGTASFEQLGAMAAALEFKQGATAGG